MDVVLLVTLRGEDEGLHEAPVRAVVVGEFSGDLDDDAFAEGGVGVHLPYLSAAVAEAKGHDALVDLLLPADGLLELAAAAVLSRSMISLCRPSALTEWAWNSDGQRVDEIISQNGEYRI